MLDQEARDAAQFQLELSREATETIIAGIEANPNLNRKQKDEQIAEARRNAVLQNNKIASSIGLAPENFVSGILGNAPQTQRQGYQAPPVFQNEQGQFRGILGSIPSMGRWTADTLISGLFGENALQSYRNVWNPSGWVSNIFGNRQG